jgi:hypothetical protein
MAPGVPMTVIPRVGLADPQHPIWKLGTWRVAKKSRFPWIDLRENLEEMMDFPMKYRGFPEILGWFQMFPSCSST